MPVHIEKMTSEIAIQEGAGALSAAQIDRIVNLVIDRLEARAREAERARAATKIGRQATKPLEWGR